MEQIKIGSFLKMLRKEKEITQEQLAEKFGVSSRTVSRWETGSNMPDISLLVELADFYGVDIREIINGERKSENMNEEVKEVAMKVADYAEAEKKLLIKRVLMINIIGLVTGITSMLLSISAFEGNFYVTATRDFTAGISVGAIICTILYLSGVLLKVHQNLNARKILKQIAFVCFAIIAMCISICFVYVWSR